MLGLPAMPEGLHWAQPQWLWLLLPWLALPWVHAALVKRQWQASLRFSVSATLAAAQAITERSSAWQRVIPPLAHWLAMACLILALAQPQALVRVAEHAVDMMLALDTSLSMGAHDVPPSRLLAARETARRFVRSLPPEIRVGLTTFSANSLVLSPPTADHAHIEALLARLNAQALRPGTAIGDAIEASLQALLPGTSPTAALAPQARPARRLLVLISDGEQQSGFPWPDAAQHAAQQNVMICTIGVGSPQGDTIRYQDQTFFVSFNDATLQELARRTGGLYFRAASPHDFETIYRTLDAQSLRTTRRPVGLAPALAGLALLLLSVAMALHATRGQVPPAL